MRKWSLSCPYCSVPFMEGNGYGDVVPPVFVPYLRCQICGRLSSTGANEFICMNYEQRLKIRASLKNCEYIEQSLDRTNNQEYREFLTKQGFKFFPITDDDKLKFKNVDFNKYQNADASYTATQGLYNVGLLIKEEEKDTTTGGFKADILAKRQKNLSIYLKAKRWGIITGIIAGAISAFFLIGFSSIPFLFLLGILFGFIVGVSVYLSVLKYYEKKPSSKNTRYKNMNLIKQVAIIVSVICGIIIVLSLILVPDVAKSEMQKAERNSKAFYTDGSINKNYTAYLVEGSLYDYSNKKDVNYYFVFQFVGGEIRCYKIAQNNNSKARVLGYFNNVCEETPSPALVLGAGFYIDIFLCIVAISATAGIWGWWFYLTKNNQSKKQQGYASNEFNSNEYQKELDDWVNQKKNQKAISNVVNNNNKNIEEKEDEDIDYATIEDKLLTLKKLYNKGLITEEEFKSHKSKIIEDEFSDSSNDTEEVGD